MDLRKYEEAYNYAVGTITALTVSNSDEKYLRNQLWRDYKVLKLDPDGDAVRVVGNVKCTADGIISMYRICVMELEADNIVDVYKACRKKPIFYFPSENGGINQSRASLLGDKIDWTLKDLKMYFSSEKDNCVLKNAYNRRATSMWLEAMGSFEQIVDWFGVKGIFTDDDYNVINIETGEIFDKNSQEKCSKEWSQNYYTNLKMSVERWILSECNDATSLGNRSIK